MAGAAYLTSVAALRSGAGLVSLAVPESIYEVWARKIPEVMVHPLPETAQGTIALKAKSKLLELLKNKTVMACGPGLSQNPETAHFVREVLSKISLPVVLDADGLNAFTGYALLLKKLNQPIILTPHPGEFQRLFQKKISSGASERKSAALEIAKKYGFTLVLKGAGTVVAERERFFVNTNGNPGMAKAGTGDVLTGVIAALLAQGFHCWDASRFGVFLHGLAGDIAVKTIGEASLTAGNLLDFLPHAIRKIRGC